MLAGVLIAESLREGVSLDGLDLVIHTLSRSAVSDASADQPKTWTILAFTSELAPELLAERLAAALDTPGWYVDFHSPTTKYVVFPGRVFAYDRGDARGREQASAYARTVGVPATQADWDE